MSDINLAAASHRQVGFKEAIQLFFKNYVDFKGRSSRGAYWWAFLALVIISVVLSIVDGIIGIQLLGMIFSLATLVPSIAIGFRRLHDINKSAWWLLLSLIPLVGAIILIVWFCKPGVRATTEFGGADVEAGR